MSVKVAGIWELSWNTPLIESWLWSFPLREFDVMDWAMTPVTGIVHNEAYSGMSLTEYNQVDEMVENFAEGHVRVFVDEKGETPLDEFVHPENAVYIFGCAGRSPLSLKKDGDLSVRMTTHRTNGVLWPHQVLVTVLYDRMVKQWPSS